MKHSHTLSAIIGGSFFAVPYLALSIPLAPSLAIAASAFVAGELIFKVDEKKYYIVSQQHYHYHS